MFKSLEKQWRRVFVDSEHNGRNMMLAAVSVIAAVLIIGIVAEFFFKFPLLGVTTAEVEEERINYIRDAPTHKTIWDLLELVIVPATLLLFGFLLGRRQDDRVQHDADRREKIDQKIAADRVQESAMQAYIDNIAQLLLADNLAQTEAGSAVRELARVRTLTVMPRLNGKRKGIILRFLAELRLIGVKGQDPVINLAGANLDDINLSKANLPEASFAHVNLAGTHLMGAIMTDTVLKHADLTGCKITNATLVRTDLRHAKLDRTDLRQTQLLEAKLDGASLDEVVYNDESTVWPDGFQPPAAFAK